MTSTNPPCKIFTKNDNGKPSFSLISQFAKELGDVNKVLEYGANKYGRDNYKLASDQVDIDRYLDACIRHVLSVRSGEVLDPESNLRHTDHAITNLVLYNYLTNQAKKERVEHVP